MDIETLGVVAVVALGGGVNEVPSRPVRRTQTIEVVDSDDGDDEDDGDNSEVEELPPFDARGYSLGSCLSIVLFVVQLVLSVVCRQPHSVISSLLPSNTDDPQPSCGVMSTVTCPVCMDTADQVRPLERAITAGKRFSSISSPESSL